MGQLAINIVAVKESSVDGGGGGLSVSLKGNGQLGRKLNISGKGSEKMGAMIYYKCVLSDICQKFQVFGKLGEI